MKSLINRVRRAYAPSQLSGRPMLENIVQPLYSTVGIDSAAALSAEYNFFQYAKGQNVPGNGDFASVPSTLWHTNMETPSSLASPKVFTITGIRCHMSHLAAAASNAPQLSTEDLATAATDLSNYGDVLKLFNSGVLRLTVGPKVYANHPLWFFPSNVGVGGLADISTAANALASTFQRSVAANHQVGQAWAFDSYPVVIAAQQSFGVNISFGWATNPTLAIDRALTVFLDGILSREVS